MRRITCLLLATAMAWGPAAAAQSLKDSVRGHLHDNLEGKEKARPSKKSKKAKKPRKKRRRRHRPAGELIWSSEPDASDTSPKENLPRRVIGKYLKIDPRVGFGVRGWIAQSYPAVDVAPAAYTVWSASLKGRFFNFVNLHHGYVESSSLAAPSRPSASQAAQIGALVPKAAWILGVVGIPVNRTWEPIIRYETRAFSTKATPNREIRIVPYDISTAELEAANITSGELTSSELDVTSSFETLIFAVRYDQSLSSSSVVESGGQRTPLPPLYFGVGLMEYRKPYQLVVGDSVNDRFLFSGQFRGAGLAFGFRTASKPRNFFLDFASQVGIGEVELTDGFTLNELLPADWLIGYVQGIATVGYLHPLWVGPPTLFLSAELSGGGATFFYVETAVEEGEQIQAPLLNWDFLGGANIALTMTF